jgi:hypothetical protein
VLYSCIGNPTLDLLLRIAQDATATLAERLKAASEAARFLD